MSAIARPPTRERGTVRPDIGWGIGHRLPGWGALPPPDELVPVLDLRALLRRAERRQFAQEIAREAAQ